MCKYLEITCEVFEEPDVKEIDRCHKPVAQSETKNLGSTSRPWEPG